MRKNGPRRRKRVVSLVSKPIPRLIGPPVKRKGSKAFFERFVVDGEEFRLNDCALLKNPDPDGEPYICRILSLFQLDEDDGVEHCEPQMTVRWFFRASDTSMSLQRMATHDPKEVHINAGMGEKEKREFVCLHCTETERKDE